MHKLEVTLLLRVAVCVLQGVLRQRCSKRERALLQCVAERCVKHMCMYVYRYTL